MPEATSPNYDLIKYCGQYKVQKSGNNLFIIIPQQAVEGLNVVKGEGLDAYIILGPDNQSLVFRRDKRWS